MYQYQPPASRISLPPLPDNIEHRLTCFAATINASAGRLIDQYRKAPMWYTLDTALAIGKDPAMLSLKLAGIPSVRSGAGTSFGFHYLHTGLVLRENAQLPGPTRRTTVFMIDTHFMKAMKPEHFTELIHHFGQVTELANHDPLHSICGDPKRFAGIDQHFRFGGVEFAPLVAHAEFVRDTFRKDPAAEAALLDRCRAYVELVKSIPVEGEKYGGFQPHLYASSILLRHLLLLMPVDAPIIKSVLDETERSVFGNRKIEVTPDSARKFLDRDFSAASHPDSIAMSAPEHTNRVIPYNHGRESILTPWFQQYFSSRFGPELGTAATVPISEMLIMDIFRRGHGIFAIQSALAALKPTQIIGRTQTHVSN